jgi:polyhydroxyalkanoate synthesis regulator phasin
MPQPKKSTASRKTTAGGASRSRSRAASTSSTTTATTTTATVTPASAADGDGRGDQLQRLLAPLDAVLVTRDRLEEVFDDAVARGRMTRSDAADLVTEILARGRRTTEDLISDVDQLLGGPADRVRREVDRARRVTGIGPAFPISGYESLSAAQVQARLGDLTPAELRKVRDYERRNANRKTVLASIESKLA